MWKRRLAWGSTAFVLFFMFTLIFGAVTSVQPAGAAVQVVDTENILQNTLTAVNTATQVAHGVLNLQSMASSELLKHYTNLSQDLAAATKVRDAYTGLLNSGQTIESAWNSSFKNVDSYFNSTTPTTLAQYTDANQNTANKLEKTYSDSMKNAKNITTTSLETSSKEIQDALNRVANATGAKEATQASTQVSSVTAQESIKTNQLLSDLVVIQAAKGQQELQDRAAALATNQQTADNYSTAVTEMQSTLKSDSRNAAEKMGESDSYVQFLKSRGLVN